MKLYIVTDKVRRNREDIYVPKKQIVVLDERDSEFVKYKRLHILYYRKDNSLSSGFKDFYISKNAAMYIGEDFYKKIACFLCIKKGVYKGISLLKTNKRTILL